MATTSVLGDRRKGEPRYVLFRVVSNIENLKHNQLKLENHMITSFYPPNVCANPAFPQLTNLPLNPWIPQVFNAPVMKELPYGFSPTGFIPPVFNPFFNQIAPVFTQQFIPQGFIPPVSGFDPFLAQSPVAQPPFYGWERPHGWTTPFLRTPQLQSLPLPYVAYAQGQIGQSAPLAGPTPYAAQLPVMH